MGSPVTVGRRFWKVTFSLNVVAGTAGDQYLVETFESYTGHALPQNGTDEASGQETKNTSEAMRVPTTTEACAHSRRTTLLGCGSIQKHFLP